MRALNLGAFDRQIWSSAIPRIPAQATRGSQHINSQGVQNIITVYLGHKAIEKLLSLVNTVPIKACLGHSMMPEIKQSTEALFCKTTYLLDK